MLQQAGYQTSRLELDQLGIGASTKKSGRGKLDEQSIGAESLDAMALIDVIESLADPSQILERCLDFLRPDGILLIHTACVTRQTSIAQPGKGMQPLDSGRHRYIFSERSVALLCERLDAPFIEFVPTSFGSNEMSLVVSRTPLEHTTPQQQSAALAKTENGRFVQAMLDVDDRRLDLVAKYRNISQQTQRMAG